MPSANSFSEDRSLLANGLHLAALANFAVAQPLFDQILRSPTLLEMWHASALEILLLVAILALGVPCILLLLEGAMPRGRATRALHLLFVAGLVSLGVAPIIERSLSPPAPWLVVGAAVTGLVAALSYDRYQVLRGLCSVLAISVPIFAASFLASPAIRQLLRPEDAFVAGSHARPVPVVLVVFDEFSLPVLLDGQGRIDTLRFPGFARLANSATWFRNATSVASSTESAVGSIVTGRAPAPKPDWKALRAANLFTLLSGSHELRVIESFVPYCPLKLCPGPGAGSPRLVRLSGLLQDVAVVFFNLVTPSKWRPQLPELSQPILLAGGRQDASSDEMLTGVARALRARERGEHLKQRAEVFDQFLATLRPSEKPGLHYLHVLLPHAPSVFLPSGRMCPAPNEPDTWGHDENAVAQAQLRYMQQVQFVDRWITKLLDRLDSTGLFDASLLLVVADHGTSFRPGALRRSLAIENECDILSVPLFMKRPGQREGSTSDENVEIIDILPTIAAGLEIAVPWTTSGHSLLAEGREARPTKVIYGPFSNPENPFFRDASTVMRPPGFALDCLDHRRAPSRIATDGSGEVLLADGSFGSLAGRSAVDVGADVATSLRVSLANRGLYSDLNSDSQFFPCTIAGHVSVAEGAAVPERIDLAIAINGRIGAVTEARRLPHDSSFRFAVPAPEGFFRPAANDLQVFAIDGDPGNLPRLSRIAQDTGSFTLRGSESAPEIEGGEGERIPVRPDTAIGAVYEISRSEIGTRVRGWALDAGDASPVAMVLAFQNGRFVHRASTDQRRPELVRRFGHESAQRAGFDFQLPPADGSSGQTQLSLFAVSQDGTASELPWSPPAPPRRHRLDPASIKPEQGHAYLALLPGEWFEFSNNLEFQKRSRLQLREDGRILGPGNSAHRTIRDTGLGSHSHWGEMLYLAASDNSDPGKNGRLYEIEIADDGAVE